MVHRYRHGTVPVAGASTPDTEQLAATCRSVSAHVDAALSEFDLRRAAAAVWKIVEEANRCIDYTRPWELAKAEQGGDLQAREHIDAALAALVRACRTLADHLQPFIPDATSRVANQCAAVKGILPPANSLFPRISEDPLQEPTPGATQVSGKRMRVSASRRASAAVK
ncbi:hypothetical protein [Streptomyces sp. NPDC020681]|uniref:hypothetical protein n=1 Tax=Streptomyces sp. NPDC020681 TaxID=3365083 RepID=UPI0037AAA132